MKKGFTLAEVLITLAIIGVIAAMTVPTLMTSTRGKEYEVAAQKALSTLSNAMQMRYAMDGRTLADYPGTHDTHLINYLTLLPDNPRPGEHPALQTTQKAGTKTFRLKDGMILLTSCSHTRPGETSDTAFIWVDTNGEKGPTRNALVSTSHGGSLSADFASANYTLSMTANGKSLTITENTSIPNNNDNPDIVAFAVQGHTGAIKPLGQRTRNILATGNAMISK